MSGVSKHVPVAIIGGGIAGAWLLRVLTDAGIDAWLFEAKHLGAGQTLASQGMIHGGLKYQLNAGRHQLGESLAHMPDFWRSCLRGDGPVDLSATSPSSDRYYLLSTGGIANRLTTFLGSRLIVGRADKCAPADYPDALRHASFKGSVYQLQDVVMNVPSLLRALTSNCAERCFSGTVTLDSIEGDRIPGLSCEGEAISADCYVFCAGAGNETLLANSPLSHIQMQRRPLKQVAVTGQLPPLYAHVASPTSGAKPRVTITTHETTTGTTWYLGGALAETGTVRTDAEQVTFARTELEDVFPWLSFDDCRFSTLDVDRAEPDQASGGLPDSPFVEQVGNAIVCWPTKLTLTPLMANLALPKIKSLVTSNRADNTPPLLDNATVGQIPFG
ncbi:MAG: hypothetical protein CNE99_00500 [OM182 bacterium MED-G24]|uniref:FAD dependent oxidoreductase domain-containing protein n=1 Tax=OM182 bacterium MED-G24 TaxID=1986255 RepID=A0A2A5X1E8_9GAMM|nr:MAG: hypothetical protein CNE99_00500 [OM182 bacterium MED-G24]|tara:strand:- start:5346 stop:6509 length:1164 start_codon:yes stop_codon:yes gene_type:complete